MHLENLYKYIPVYYPLFKSILKASLYC